MKHTKGKWTRSGSVVYCGKHITAQVSWPMGKSEFREKAKEIAQLIAAAPELLEALKELQKSLLQEVQSEAEATRLYNLAEQAIKKAEG